MWFIQYSSLSLALLSPVLAAVLPSWNSFPGHDPAIDNRTLDEIYAAAKKEGGVLTVLSGGDGMYQLESLSPLWSSVDLIWDRNQARDLNYRCVGS